MLSWLKRWRLTGTVNESAVSSFIYQFNRGDAGFILRVGHSRRRRPFVRHEVGWLNYLAAGLAVAGAVPFSQNLEAVRTGRRLVATAFCRAKAPPWGSAGRLSCT
jgi:Ser/Thr protein kinase RdoA (MazF antagonist)